MSDRAATFRQLLFANLILLVAVGSMVNRHRLPAALRIETYQQRDENPLALQVHLSGRSTLLVGDSLVNQCPWDVDLLCAPGHSTMQIADELRPRLASRRYEYIVLWPGTAHLANSQVRGDVIGAYVEAMVELVQMATLHADRVIVLSPMPYDAAQYARLVADAGLWATLWRPENLSIAQEAVERLPSAVPDVLIYDMHQFRAMALDADGIDRFFRDGVHLSPAGFALLAEQLRPLGIAIPLPPPGPTARAGAGRVK